MSTQIFLHFCQEREKEKEEEKEEEEEEEEEEKENIRSGAFGASLSTPEQRSVRISPSTSRSATGSWRFRGRGMNGCR